METGERLKGNEPGINTARFFYPFILRRKIDIYLLFLITRQNKNRYIPM